MKLTLPENVIYIIDKLESAGYEAYAVGGAVRDSLLGRAVGDYDITTDALPDEVKRIFSKDKIIETGLKHGTLTVVLDHIPYEVTTYRIDGDYVDNRHPDAVTFTDKLSEDLKRRDFTVNAMCYSNSRGIVDLFGGESDLENKIIRAVGDPRERFEEDGLRIIRALRFASVLDFNIDEETSCAIRDKKELLENISRERIYTELKKLIMGKGAHRILSGYPEVISVALGGFTPSALPEIDLFDRADFISRLASLFLLGSEIPTVSAACALEALRAEKSTRIAVNLVLSAYPNISLDSENDFLRALFDYGADGVGEILELCILTGKYSDMKRKMLSDILDSDSVYSVSHLAVGGNDLSDCGFFGREIGEMLELLVLAVIDLKVANNRDALINYAQDEKQKDLKG